VSVLWSNLLGRVELRHCGQAASSCPHRSTTISQGAPERTRCLRFPTSEAAANWLQGALSHPDDVTVLRQVLEPDQRQLAWLTNRQVVERVADRILRRDLCLVAALPLAHDTTVRNVVEPPPVIRTGTPLAQRRESPAIAPPVQEPNFEDDLNQALQAKALEDAAATGVPFCEECEKARRSSAA